MQNIINERSINKSLSVLFVLLYLATAVVSCAHAIEFFNIGNNRTLSIILAIAFELGQAGCLFALLINRKNKITPWVMTFILASVQCIGNIFCTYRYMVQNSSEQIQYFTQSILFFIQSPNQQANITIISYIIGGLLPLICLGLTSLVVEINSKQEQSAEVPEKKAGRPPKKQNTETKTTNAHHQRKKQEAYRPTDDSHTITDTQILL